jgi:anti-anti-sigma factor
VHAVTVARVLGELGGRGRLALLDLGERRAREARDLLARQQPAEAVRRDAVQRELAGADALGQLVPAARRGDEPAAEQAGVERGEGRLRAERSLLGRVDELRGGGDAQALATTPRRQRKTVPRAGTAPTAVTACINRHTSQPRKLHSAAGTGAVGDGGRGACNNRRRPFRMRERRSPWDGDEADPGGGGRALTGAARGMKSRPFRCDVARDGAGVRITLEGELDIASAPALESALGDSGNGDGPPERRVVDLRGLTFIDSSGLRAILVANGAARRDGWKLQIVAGPPAVQRVFEICGATDGLCFVDP